MRRLLCWLGLHAAWRWEQGESGFWPLWAWWPYCGHCGAPKRTLTPEEEQTLADWAARRRQRRVGAC